MGETQTEVTRLDARYHRPGRARTKVVATIGPASEDRIADLVDAGMSVARINFSHGTREDHRRWIEKVRRVAADKGAAVGILVDIGGPKLRLGTFPGGAVELRRGDRVRLVEGGGPAGEGEIPLALDGCLSMLREGHRVLLADGGVELVALDGDESVRPALVRRGGTIGDRKGLHLPDTDLDLAVPTRKDEDDLAFSREVGVDMIGASFVSRPEEVQRVRELAPEALVVAKIERKGAIDRFAEILTESDGVMVARGDLGVEMSIEQLPMLQKWMLSEGLGEGRFTITATEMLESMVTSSRPTRAEVADVANAVFDGTDAVMLSAETAIGRYPVESVEMMDRIAKAVESSQRYREQPRVAVHANPSDVSNATALAAYQAAEVLGVEKIVCFTETGNTVRQVSRYRPRADVIALTPHRRTLDAMTVLAHVRPMPFPRLPSLEAMLARASIALVESGMASDGELIVFVAGVPPGVARSTNVVKIHRIGEQVRLETEQPRSTSPSEQAAEVPAGEGPADRGS